MWKKRIFYGFVCMKPHRPELTKRWFFIKFLWKLGHHYGQLATPAWGMRVPMVRGLRPIAVYWLLSLCATGVLRPACNWEHIGAVFAAAHLRTLSSRTEHAIRPSDFNQRHFSVQKKWTYTFLNPHLCTWCHQGDEAGRILTENIDLHTHIIVSLFSTM